MFLNLKNEVTLDNIKLSLLALYIIFNFVDRHIGNIFLLLCLLLCLIDYKSILANIVRYKHLIMSIAVFSIYITIIGFLHQSPAHELDNYYRFLLLLPILSIGVKYKTISAIIKICMLFAVTHFILVHCNDQTLRYSGTSSNAITYANLCALMSIVSLYLFIESRNNKKDKMLILSSLIFLLIYIFTETRGPIIGILLSIIFICLILKKTSSFLVLFFILISLIYVPNPIYERLKNIQDINYNDPISIPHTSLRERLFYLYYGYDELKNNALLGIGPQNLQPRMSNYLNNNDINIIKPRDHLHNDFLDIAVKFGIPALLLLLFLYLNMLKSYQPQCKFLGFIVMIMLVCSQLTQSQFAHNQAITFFIVLLYLVMNLKIDSRVNSVTNK